MPPYSRHHKYSKKIQAAKKEKFPTFAGIKTQKLPNFIRIATQELPSSSNYNSKIAEFFKKISNFVQINCKSIKN